MNGHRAKEQRRALRTQAPPTPVTRFDEAFRTLAKRCGVRASYVVVETIDVAENTSHLVTGGDPELDSLVTAAIRAHTAPTVAAADTGDAVAVSG